MKKLIDAYFRLLNWLLVGTIAILLVPVTMQIISRYTALIPSYIWTEELSRFLFIWMIMLGAMIAVREGTHLDVDLWPDLSPRTEAVTQIVASLFVLEFACVFVYWGIKFVQFWVEPAIRTGRIADDVHLHCLAACRADVALVPGRAVRRQLPHPCVRNFAMTQAALSPTMAAILLFGTLKACAASWGVRPG